MKIKYLYLAILSFVLVFSSCEDSYLERTSESDVSDVVAYNSIEGLQGIMHGVYRKLYQNDRSDPGFQGMPGKLFMYDSRCEDVVFSKSSWIQMDQFLWYNGERWTTTNQNWSFYYNIIVNTNHVLGNIAKFPDSGMKNSVEGQARTMRAYAYFYLIRLYQHSYSQLAGNTDLVGKDTPAKAPGVVLVKEVTMKGLPRSSVQDCYDLILDDLTKAETLMATATEREHKSMVNLDVVSGLLARVNLEISTPASLVKAATYAKAARAGYDLMTTSEYVKGFNDLDNNEWIWGLAVQKDQTPVNLSLYNLISDHIKGEGYYIYSIYFSMDKPLQDKIAANDVRKDVFVPEAKSRIETKQVKFQGLKNHVSAHTLMRASEMVLIEAEAKYRTGDVAGAKTLLLKLRQARLKSGTASVTGDVLDAIYLERRIELWGEGFRFFDIKRTGVDMNRGVGIPSSYWNKSLGLPNPTEMRYMKAGEPLFNMQLPLKEFEGNSALDHDKDQNPPARL